MDHGTNLVFAHIFSGRLKRKRQLSILGQIVVFDLGQQYNRFFLLFSNVVLVVWRPDLVQQNLESAVVKVD